MWRPLRNPIRYFRVRRLEITPGFIAALCLFCLADQQNLLLPLLAALAAHETGHLIAIRLQGARVYLLRLGFLDARIVCSTLGYRQEAIAALAGPGVSLLSCALFRRQAPDFAAISLLLGLFNLLPVWPLDGGRAVRAMLGLRMSLARAERVSRQMSIAICTLGLAGTTLCALRFEMGMGPVLLWCVVLARLLWCGREERLDSMAAVRYNK